MKSIKSIPKFDRPREKLKRRGAKSLSDMELLAVMLGSGTKEKDVFKVAKDVLAIFRKDFLNIDFNRLKKIDGVGDAKAAQLLAAVEFSKRFLIKDDIKITNARDVVKIAEELKNKKQEYFLTFTLDGANVLIHKRVIFIGTLNESLVHPREVFADAITDRAASVIFVHNHPSGNFEPSKEDIAITERLVKVGKIVGTNVLDHIIISKNGYFSFNENDLL